MSDNSEIKIQRWERYIEECRREAKLLSPEGQRTMQTVIDSYERLIDHGTGPGQEKKVKPVGRAPGPLSGAQAIGAVTATVRLRLQVASMS